MDLRSQLRNNLHGMGVRRAARPQPSAAQRSGQETTLNGNPLRARTVTNEPLGTGDAVFLVSDSGVTQQERRKVQRGVEVGRPTKEAIDLKILASGVDSAGTHIFIGGDRKIPTEILVLPVGETISFSRIENLGIGHNRWIVALKINKGGGIYKIYTKFGETPSKDWQLQDPKVRVLNYFGQGFWSGLVEKAPINFLTIGTPDLQPDQTHFFFDNRPGEVRGVVNCGLTEDEFWKVSEISKTYVVNNSSGFKANINEWTFTGTNTLYSSVIQRAFWLGQPPILPAYYPYGNSLMFERIYRQIRNLITQYPSFYSIDGTIQVFAGSYIYTENREAKSTYTHRRYQGLDVVLLPEDNYDIGYDDALTIRTLIQVGPNVSKQLKMDPGPRANLYQFPTVTYDIPAPIDSFEGGIIYSQSTGVSGFNYTGYVFSGLTPPYISPVLKQYLRLDDGSEKEIKFTNRRQNFADNYINGYQPPGGIGLSITSWRKADNSDPVLREIGALPPISSSYSPAISPLLKEKWEWTVTSTQPVNNAGALDYTPPKAISTKKNVKTYPVLLPDTLNTQKVLDAN
jgi:hypothetical protein